MANTTIHTLSYNLVMNAEKFQAGSIATKKELAAGKKLFMETRTDAERYGAAVDHLGDLLRKGSIDQDTYARSLKRMQDQQKSATASTKGMSTAFAGVKTQLSALLPVITAAGVIGGLKNTTDAIDSTAKAARKFGVDFNELRQIQYAASIDTSVSVEQLGKALQRLSIFVSEAGEGSETTAKALGTLNLEADDLRGKSLPDQFGLIADGIAQVTDENDRLAAAQDIFGKSGADLIPMLEKGSASIKQLADEHQRLVGNLTDEQTSKIENANDQLTRVGASMSKIAESAAVLAAGPLEKVAKGLTLAAGYLAGDKTFTRQVLETNQVDKAILDQMPERAPSNWFFKVSRQLMYGGMSGRYSGLGSGEIDDYMAYQNAMRQRSITATGGVDANGITVKLAPESIDAINNGEIQSQRRTRLD